MHQESKRLLGGHAPTIYQAISAVHEIHATPMQLAVQGARRAVGAVSEQRPHVRAALAGAPGTALASALAVARYQPRPSGEVLDRGKVRVRFGPDLQQQRPRTGAVNSGQGVEQAQLRLVGRQFGVQCSDLRHPAVVVAQLLLQQPRFSASEPRFQMNWQTYEMLNYRYLKACLVRVSRASSFGRWDKSG